MAGLQNTKRDQLPTLEEAQAIVKANGRDYALRNTETGDVMPMRLSQMSRDVRRFYGNQEAQAPTLKPVDRADPAEIQAYIRQKAQENGINPALMLALAERESQFDNTVKSRIKKKDYNKIGVGLYQFIPPTAAQYGLADADRRDYRKSTDAAMRLMTDLKNEFKGDERLALAAWNAGIGNAKRGTGVRGALAKGLDPDRITEGGHVAAVLNNMQKWQQPTMASNP